MNTTLGYRGDFLYVVEERNDPTGLVKEWRPVRKAERAEVQTLLGRPVKGVNLQEGIYVDEEENVYQLADRGKTKPVEVEHLPGTEKTDLEVMLEASLKGGQANGKNGGAKRLLRKNRNSGRKQQASQDGTGKTEPRPAETPTAVEASASTFHLAAS